MDTIAQFIGYTVMNIIILTVICWLVQTARKNGLLKPVQKGQSNS